MASTLLAFHGFTQNGDHLRAHLGPLIERLPDVPLVCPDGPHLCDAASVERLAALWPVGQGAPPHRCWWDATDDGRVYRGWETTRALVGDLLGRYPGAGILGFSQGAILAANIAVLAERGALPPPRFVVLVAGRLPRADALRALFDRPIALPSLHVWGERDPIGVSSGDLLAEQFRPEQREVVVWHGPHVVPTRGAAADAIVRFVARHGGPAVREAP